jgi:signal transduction histidine kinase
VISPPFVEKVIHDLQNRLHVLSMGLELAGRGLNEQVEPRRFLDIVGSINRSVENLRDYLGSLEGGLPAAQDPAEIFSAVLSSMRKELSRKSINLRLVRREPVPMVKADREQLCSAFERIIEFCGALVKKGGELKVEAGPKEVGGQVFAEFKVTTSPATAFELVEGQDSQAYMNLKVRNEGVGVGLALAAEILRRYQGQVSVRKENLQQGQLTVLMKSSGSER